MNKGSSLSLLLLVSLLAGVGYKVWFTAPLLPSNPTNASIPADTPDMLSTADVKKGEQLTSICHNCHDFTLQGKHKVGPNLAGVYGAKIARHLDYKYSEVFKGMRNQTWTADNLYDFLRDPSKFAPKTSMSFGGILDPQDRIDVIAYLATLKN